MPKTTRKSLPIPALAGFTQATHLVNNDIYGASPIENILSFTGLPTQGDNLKGWEIFNITPFALKLLSIIVLLNKETYEDRERLDIDRLSINIRNLDNDVLYATELYNRKDYTDRDDSLKQRGSFYVFEFPKICVPNKARITYNTQIDEAVGVVLYAHPIDLTIEPNSTAKDFTEP